jgi:hypothetical protein
MYEMYEMYEMYQMYGTKITRTLFKIYYTLITVYKLSVPYSLYHWRALKNK